MRKRVVALANGGRGGQQQGLVLHVSLVQLLPRFTSSTGRAGATISADEHGRYDEAVQLESGDIVVAGDKLVRFAKKR